METDEILSCSKHMEKVDIDTAIGDHRQSEFPLWDELGLLWSQHANQS